MSRYARSALVLAVTACPGLLIVSRRAGSRSVSEPAKMAPTITFDNLELHKPQKCRKARISGPYTTSEHPLVRTRAQGR
jgi:hypothetical protein